MAELIQAGRAAAEIRTRVAPVSRATVYRLISSGQLPAGRIGGKLLIQRETLDRFIAACLAPAERPVSLYARIGERREKVRTMRGA